MALSDEIRAERQKLKGKGAKAYWEYFWEYYKLPAAGIIFGVIFVVSMAHAILTSKDTGFGAVFVNAAASEYTMDQDVTAQLAADFAEYAGINTKEYNVNLDMTEFLTVGFPGSEQDYAVLMKITTQQAAGELDVMVADAFYFWYYARNGLFLDLRDVYSEEELANLPGDIYYMDQAALEARLKAYEEDPAYMEEFPTDEQATAFENPATFVLPDPTEMEDPVPYGIVVSDAPWIQKLQLYPGAECVLGFISNGSRMDASRAFAEYIYN